MKKKSIFLTIGLIAASPILLHAQNEVADSLEVSGYELLDEVVVEATVPVVQSNGAKTTYNVDEDPGASSSTMMDMLRKVPMVSVDGDGNIRLNGQSNFKFQVDGVENPMLKQYASQVLNAMPASAVVKIEVITEPGAKEDAEGVAGVINIITSRKQSQDGYSGNLSLRLSNRDLGPSAYGIFKKDKVTVSANINYVWGFGAQKGENNNTIDYLTSSNAGRYETQTGQKSKFHYLGGNLNLSWEPDENNLFTLSANVTDIDGSLNSIYSTNTRFDEAGNLLWMFRQSGAGRMKMLNLSTNLSYRHNFRPQGNYLILSYLFNYGKTNIWYDLLTTQTQNYPSLNPYEKRNADSFNRGHTVQMDYANNFQSDKHLMEIGAKGIFRRNSALSDYLSGQNELDYFPIEDMFTNIRQPQDIYAAYASYTGQFGALSAVGGIRYEHTRMGIRDIMEPEKSFNTRLNDWVPNLALTWSFSPGSNLRAAYQMRISRPSIDQVNPFELALNPYEVRTGNPDLSSEKSHKITLSYTEFGRVFGGNIALEYTLVDNAISGYTYLKSDGGTNILYTSFANIGKTNNYAVTGFLNWNIIQHMSLSLNGRLEYANLKASAMGYKNHGWGGNIGGAWNYTVASVNKFSVYGGWSARRITIQGYSSGYYYYGLSASRDFLKDKSLNLGLSAINFLTPHISYKSKAVAHDAINFSEARSLTAWQVAVSVTWKFGSLNAQVKKTGADVNNDDVNTSSNKSNSGGL